MSPYVPGRASGGMSRPGTVTAASWMTWLAALLPILVALFLLLSRNALVEIAQGIVAQGPDALRDLVPQEWAEALVALVRDVLPELRGYINRLALSLLIWGTLMVAVSALAFRGSRVAAWILTLMGLVSVVLSAPIILAGEVISLLLAMWTIAVIVLYHLPKSRQWYANPVTASARSRAPRGKGESLFARGPNEPHKR